MGAELSTPTYFLRQKWYKTNKIQKLILCTTNKKKKKMKQTAKKQRCQRLQKQTHYAYNTTKKINLGQS